MSDDTNEAMRAWAQANASPEQRQETRARTGLAPGAVHGTYAVPFPRTARSEYLAAIKGAGVFKRAEKVKPTEVSLKDLRAIQGTVNAERLRAHFDDPNLVPKGTRAPGHGGFVDHPTVVKKNGVFFLHDGTHRATVAMLRGQDRILARVVDLDAET